MSEPNTEISKKKRILTLLCCLFYLIVMTLYFVYGENILLKLIGTAGFWALLFAYNLLELKASKHPRIRKLVLAFYAFMFVAEIVLCVLV